MAEIDQFKSTVSIYWWRSGVANRT